MKKLIIYFCVFLLVFFIAPAVLTATPKDEVQETMANEEKTGDLKNEEGAVSEEEKKPEDEEQEENKDYEYQQFKTIKLLHQDTGQVEELPIDEYLYGVVSSEMPADFQLEALKAQAVVARTYTIFQIKNSPGKHGDADICDNSGCCQAWITKEGRLARWEPSIAESNWNKIVEAVDSTKGKIITYDGNVINAFFHSNSGGVTESSLNIWGGVDYPYLKSVETAGEEGYTQYSSQASFNRQELLNKIREKYPDCEIDYSQNNCIEILEYTTSGRVKTIKFGNKEIAGTEARTLLGLRSTNFTLTIDGENIIFSVTGYGHGVGMSQTGADSLAKTGSNYEDIIKHFYTGVEIIEVNSLK